jgi:hypothetical protein
MVKCSSQIRIILSGSSLGSAQAQSSLGDPRDIGLELVADGLTSLIGIVAAPDESGRLFVLDQIGLIRIVTSDGTLLAEPFLDLRSKIVPLMSAFDERGLLGLAFHPNYPQNARFFVYDSALCERAHPPVSITPATSPSSAFLGTRTAPTQAQNAS